MAPAAARAALVPVPVPLAHAGHWINGALYLAPVAIVVLLLFVQSRRDRVDGGERTRGPDEPDQRPTGRSRRAHVDTDRLPAAAGPRKRGARSG